MEPPSSPPILVPEPRWRRAVAGDLELLVRRALALAGGADAVVLADDRTVRRLNVRHRGRNKATNVLTFETGTAPGAGEIVLAFGVVRREARAAARPVAHHLAHLVVHGALHLRGHDHAEAGQARRMEREEARLLSRLGIPNPWKPRPSPSRMPEASP